jgi:hypothetical protein
MPKSAIEERRRRKPSIYAGDRKSVENHPHHVKRDTKSNLESIYSEKEVFKPI